MSNSGAWTEEIHKKIGPNLNKGLISYIAQTLKPVSVLEFGSGLGHMSKYLNDNCTTEKVHCIEPHKMVGVYDIQNGPVQFAIDIFKDLVPQELNRTYDLVMSIEVAEHIERKLHNELFDFLVFHTHKWIVFSAGHLGQKGRGHIACREEQDWRSEFLKRDMTFLPEITQAARVSCDQRNGMHRKNIQVFRA